MGAGMFFGTTNLNPGFKPEDAVSLTYPDVPLLKMDRNGTLDNFTTVVLRAMKFFQRNIMKRAPATHVPLVAGYPSQKILESSFIKTRTNINDFNELYYLDPFANLVTYTIKYQGPMGYKKVFGEERARAPILRETLKVKEQPGVVYDVYTQMMDNLIQFDCWSSTGRGADNLIAWFKYFMEFMKGPIMQQGFTKIQFWERGVDRDVTSFRDDIAVRSLQFYVQTQEQYIVPTSLIKQIGIDIETSLSFDEELVSFLADQSEVSPSGANFLNLVPVLSGLRSTGSSTLTENH